MTKNLNFELFNIKCITQILKLLQGEFEYELNAAKNKEKPNEECLSSELVIEELNETKCISVHTINIRITYINIQLNQNLMLDVSPFITFHEFEMEKELTFK